MGLSDDIAAFTEQRLRHYLAEAGGNVTRAAKLAGRHRTDFHKLMAQHGIAGVRGPTDSPRIVSEHARMMARV